MMLCSLVKESKPVVVPEKEKSANTSRQTFYNRPMPKTSNNIHKSSIPRINHNTRNNLNPKNNDFNVT